MSAAVLLTDHPVLTEQERVLAAIVDDVKELSTALDSVVDPRLALTYLEALALRIEAWRMARAELVHAYMAFRIPARLWQTRVRRRDRHRALDIDAQLCVRHAWHWLRPVGGVGEASAGVAL